jgi:acyl carrier protein
MTPLGRPLTNTQVYILDRLFQPAPVGVAGELFIGGENVGRGYLCQPGLTAERFIPNPFGSGRLYRTGDRARYLRDGSVEFLGRLDDQVKIRGFRIELGEIEAELARHPAVRLAAVNPFTASGDERQLAAYVVLNEREVRAADPGAFLRPFLKERLPEYMIPVAYVALNELPRTAHGKLNRQQLPRPDAHHFSRSLFVEPATPVEEEIAAIWRDILKMERIGVDENFFRLGGHSLMATRVIARIRAAFEVELPLRSIFESPTIMGLSEKVEDLLLTQLSGGGQNAPEREEFLL